MRGRGILVGAMVTVGGIALAAKKFLAEPELREDAKEKGKRVLDDIEEFATSAGNVCMDTVNKVADEFKQAAKEAKEQLEKEKDTDEKEEDTDEKKNNEEEK